MVYGGFKTVFFYRTYSSVVRGTYPSEFRGNWGSAVVRD
jgi:hypothetical protein